MTLLHDVYAALSATVQQLGDEEQWVVTGCTGWTVRDLVWHLHADAVRGLVAAHTPAHRPADCDAVAYWRSWGSDPRADDRTRRLTRVEAGLHEFSVLRPYRSSADRGSAEACSVRVLAVSSS
jgi:hypothetical protein